MTKTFSVGRSDARRSYTGIPRLASSGTCAIWASRHCRLFRRRTTAGRFRLPSMRGDEGCGKIGGRVVADSKQAATAAVSSANGLARTCSRSRSAPCARGAAGLLFSYKEFFHSTRRLANGGATAMSIEPIYDSLDFGQAG